MKKTLLFLVATLYVLSSIAQNWRDGEKQIIINIENQTQANLLGEILYSYDDYGPNKIRAYVVPKEIKLIESAGIAYTVEIEDLAAHSQSLLNSKDEWHSYQEIIDLADSLVQEFPAICEKHVFGTSMGGRQLAALKISDNVSTDESEAEVFFDGGIHGDEYPAAENVIRFARDICIAYDTDPDITFLIDNREIWLYLMVNPDGRVNIIRYNNNGVDLNRDWGFMWDGAGSSTGAFSQVESKALRSCVFGNQFVVHTTYHAGTEYISCPWSYRPDTPADMSHILQLCGVYASSSLYTNIDYGQGYSGMYAINGSTKDSNYGLQGAISWSMEISYDKMPSNSQITPYYNKNYPAMLAMIEYAGYGLEGLVSDANTGDPVSAIVFVEDYMQTFSDPTAGDYHKYVLPGTYSIKVMANGYQTQIIDNIVVTENSSTATDFQLIPEDGQYVYKFCSSQIPGNNHADEGNSMAVFGEPDNVNYSIGKNGMVVLDMQYPVIDGPGFDIIVYEGDSSPEGFTCYAGETMDGPWISLGTGNGTSEFDIAISNLPEAQYFKIMDDGDGSGSIADAGFDLDGIEALEALSGVYIAMYEYSVDDSNGNNNGKIDPGETVDIIVTLKNNGDITSQNTIGDIITTSTWLTVVSGNADFGTLAQSQTSQGVFSVLADENTPAGQPAEIELSVTSNSGAYTNDFMMNFVIGQIPVVIIDLDGNSNSGVEIEATLQNMDLGAEYVSSFPADMSIYSSAFVCLGIYSDNHALSTGEGQALADFLNNGGSLYMEGGDTWYYDTQTSVHTMFNINGESDGSGDLGTIVGQSGTFTEGMSFQYSGDNNWVDQISAIGDGQLIFENQSPSYGNAVSNDAGNYKTIGSSFEFGGLDDGTSTKEELMQAYLDFFGFTSTLQASFNVNSSEICEGESVNFNDASTGEVISWDWIFEGGSPATSTEQNPTIEYASAGTYDVSLTISDGTDTQTINMEDYISVETIPFIPGTPQGPGGAISYPGNTDDYTTSGSANANSYIWEIEPAEAGTLTQNNETCTVDWTDWWVGTATVKVMALNYCGESEYSEGFDVEVVISNVRNAASENISIYPNPTTDNINIDFGKLTGQKFEIEVVNSLGETVVIESKVTDSYRVYLENEKPGIYFISITGKDLKIFEKVILK